MTNSDENPQRSSPKVRFAILGDGGVEPRRVYAGDVGYDLYSSVDVVVPPGTFRDIPHEVAVEYPRGVWGMITGRSSSLRHRGLLVSQGILDNGYRGPLFTGVWNLTGEPVTVSVGERVSQMILFPMVVLPFEEVANLSESDRGLSAFGSTGQ